MNAKYFKTLPDQEYVFKNFFTCGKNEGMCCSDCGTYITNVVEVIGRADRQSYYLGTTCCDKISKDRSVFLTPLSVQRKKIFITQFKKFHKVRKDLETLADTFGGAVLKFADIDYDYRNNLRVTLFIFCANNMLIFNHLEEAQRCFAGLKEILDGYTLTFDCGDFFGRTWNTDTFFVLKKLVGDAYKIARTYRNDETPWHYFLESEHSELFEKWVHFENTELYNTPLKEIGWDKLSTHPQIF